MNMRRWVPKIGPVLPWRMGQILQGLLMGILLVVSALGWLTRIGHVATFQYQAF